MASNRPRGGNAHDSARVRFDLSAPQLLVGSFAALIAMGTLGFLILPGLWIGERPSVVDALFMATSAVTRCGYSCATVHATAPPQS